MRFLIFFGILGAIVWYVINTVKTGGPKDLIGGGIDKLTWAALPADKRPKPAAAVAEVPVVQAEETGVKAPFKGATPAVLEDEEIPKGSKTYRFKHREAPLPAEIMGSMVGGSCSVLVDKATGTVSISGPVDAVGVLHGYLEVIDLVAPTCAVQTWAVYVDRSVEKGFDLLAALRAVGGAEASFAVETGGGGLTLDMGADRVAGALSAIADGSAVEVMQRPHVRLKHGVPSRIESIQEVPVPSTSVSQGIAQTSINYRKVGLQLEVMPHFLASDSVNLVVKQSNGLIGQNVEIDGNTVPVIESQLVETAVSLTVGQTVVLGGVSTLRERTVKGLFRNQREISEGALYVILSTYYDVPKAVPVGSPQYPIPAAFEPPPFTSLMDSPADWIGSQLLPAKGSVRAGK